MRIQRSRQFTRLRNLAEDVRVQRIQQAVGQCAAAGRARLHVANGQYAWPRHFVALLDELVLHGVPPAEIAAVGVALKLAVDETLFAGNAAPAEPVGVTAAEEAVIQGEADRATILAIHAPHDARAKRQAVDQITAHISWLERLRRVFLRDLHQPRSA